MPLSDLFDNEFKQRNRGHFSAIVRVALAGGEATPEEKKFLEKLARNLEITESEYEEIMANPLKYPVNPPSLRSQRLERLYDLVRMVHTDHQLGDSQDILLKKIGLALGFTPENTDLIIAKAFSLADKKVDLDTFIYEMEHMNK